MGTSDMARIVQKFGGTSVADMARIKAVAATVKRELDDGNEVAVVLSAMAGVTDQLVGYTAEAGGAHYSSECDAVLATGEQVTAGLVALSLQEMGIQARSWLGWQIPIRTVGGYGKARIEKIVAGADGKPTGTEPFDADGGA